MALKKQDSPAVTPSGLPVRDCYDAADVSSDAAARLGRPGEFPFVRGIYPEMYRQRPWTMRQYAGFGTAAESNRRYRYLLEQGQTGLSVAFDLPTQIGYDSDDPMAEGEVGKVGVAIDTLADMERLFEGIPLGRVSTSMTINATAAVLLAMYVAVARKQGVKDAEISGTVQNDILKEYIARGTYIYPPAPSLRLVTDLFRFAARTFPRFNSISISGYHIREAGATAVQELAFTLANAICYVNEAVRSGLDVDSFAGRISFFFNGHSDLFEEVAKFRAARGIWARIMRDRFGARDPRSQMLRFHTQTAGSMLTAQQPDNNVVRVTLQALAAVLGGTQSLHTNARDEALGLPTEHAAELALRTQQILAFESGVTRTADPLAGSYYVEALTLEVERQVLRYLDDIEKLGGALKAVESGYYQREIQKSAYSYQKAVDEGRRVVVGVNLWATDEPRSEETLKVDPALRAEQCRFLAEVKAGRNNQQVEASLAELSRAAATDGPLVETILECVQAYATVGEISNRLRGAWGEYREQVVL